MKSDLSQRLQAFQERLDHVTPNLRLQDKEAELANLQAQMQRTDFWSDQKKAQEVSQKAAALESTIKAWEKIETTAKQLPELLEISEDQELGTIEQELQILEAEFKTLETETFLADEHDDQNAILSIHVGNGGQDAEDFCQMLFRMYGRYAERKDWNITVMDQSTSDAGIKSATLRIQGPKAYGYLKSEHGVHRLIRLSPFNAKNLRQTSFARIDILPEIKDEAQITIDDQDLKVDVFRSSGAGGQSVNTTDSAVRITYLPLSISVTCQNERSQLQNKQNALKILKSRLAKLKAEQKAERLEELKGDVGETSFGSQIRTYTLQPYKLVKDHRTDFEHTNPDAVFDGDLDGFVEAYLRQ